MNFSNKDYKEVAKRVIKIKDFNLNRILSKEEAFYLLIKDIKQDEISNLLNEISLILNININEAYKYIQEVKTLEDKKVIYNAAIKLLENNTYMGNNVVPNTNINTTSWISHSLYEAILSSNLALMLNLNSNFAFSYGLLHDFGRKYINDFTHVIKGFERLIDMGYYNESKASLTHSFINGGRFNNNEVKLNDKEYNDDVDEILKISVYNDYDYILNIADLMATSFGIVSPSERVKDIASRRKNIDKSPNRKYFFISFYNLLVSFLEKINKNNGYNYINSDKIDLEKIKEMFDLLSEYFYNIYLEYINNQKEVLKRS